MISIKNGSFSYPGGPPVFRDISFSLEEGRILSIIGYNGSGKTTLIKCLSGIQDFSSGEVSIRGQNSVRGIERTRSFGYVPQLTANPVPYTVEQMVLLGRSRFLGPFSKPGRKDWQVIRDVMELTGTTPLAARSFHTLSGGERQMVLIAQALATEARALIFDEPTSALDLINQHHTVDLLRRLSHEQGYTVIFSSHDPSHALHISDCCLMLKKGLTHIFGPSEEVITESCLGEAFGIEARIYTHINDDGEASKGVLPILKPYRRE